MSKQENIDYISADIRKNAAKICADITALPFSDEMFDVIVCNHLLEHIEDDYKAIGEMYRVLKRGGWALVSYPVYVEETFEDFSIISEEERERVFKQKDHVRLCGLDYCKRLQQMGFDTRFMNYSDYSDEERQVLGLTNFPNSVFYVCWK